MDADARREYQRRYYEANRETLLQKQRERSRANYQANPELYKERSKRWKAANPERMAELQRKHADENRDTIRERSRAWYHANTERARVKGREAKVRRYGLTLAQFDALLTAQSGCCAICGTDTPSKKAGDSFRIDHCHTTGAVRGLLCMKCNAGLGMFADSPDLLVKAADYLIRSASLVTDDTGGVAVGIGGAV